MVKYKLRKYKENTIIAEELEIGEAFKLPGNGEVYFRVRRWDGETMNTTLDIFTCNTNTGRMGLLEPHKPVVPLHDVLITYSQKEVQYVEA